MNAIVMKEQWERNETIAARAKRSQWPSRRKNTKKFNFFFVCGKLKSTKMVYFAAFGA
jgi:hypothetical protein